MTKHKSKAELLKDIQVQRKQLLQKLEALTPTELIADGVVGGWSVKDLLAHLVAWERLLLSWYEAGRHDRVPTIAPVGLSRKAIDELNARTPVAAPWKKSRPSFRLRTKEFGLLCK